MAEEDDGTGAKGFLGAGAEAEAEVGSAEGFPQPTGGLEIPGGAVVGTVGAGRASMLVPEEEGLPHPGGALVTPTEVVVAGFPATAIFAVETGVVLVWLGILVFAEALLGGGADAFLGGGW